jgi:ribonucleoside-diphosphate reductase alpha chain
MIKLKSSLRAPALKAGSNGRIHTGKGSSRRVSNGTAHPGGLKFNRAFAQKAVKPFDEIEWDFRTAEITDDSGKTIFKQENVEVPKSWSPLATKIAVSKYFYGDPAHGFDPYKGGRENSIRQLVHRVTRTITDCGIADGYFRGQGERRSFLRRPDVALRESIRRVQLAGLVQCRPLSPIPRRRG